MRERRPPHDCPVCGDELAITRLSCSGCGTELSGAFEACEFCALGADERELLRVFLASRGNMKELERHLGVSYPTARARYDGVLVSLGIERATVDPQVELLESLARGETNVDDVLNRLT